MSFNKNPRMANHLISVRIFHINNFKNPTVTAVPPLLPPDELPPPVSGTNDGAEPPPGEREPLPPGSDAYPSNSGVM